MAGNFTIIDYSVEYYKSNNKPVPRQRYGKFIQIVNQNKKEEYLILAAFFSITYHANIVEKFCKEKLITGCYKSKKLDFYEINDPNWIIKGGGLWELDEEKKTFNLFGVSKSYGRFEQINLKNKISKIKFFSLYTIKIDGI